MTGTRRQAPPPAGAEGAAAAAPPETTGLVTRQLVMDRGDAGQRLDRALLRRIADVPGISRTRIQRWIAQGRVRVGGRRPAKPSVRVAFADLVDVELPPLPARAVPHPERLDVAVLYDDPHLLVVDKPAGLVAHPAYKHAHGTLLNALLWLGARDEPAWAPRLVHRLDRQTSGVLLVAKNADAHRALAAAWRTREVRKTYLAVVWGRPARRRGEIRLKLDRDPVDTRRVIASETRGRESVTRYALVATSRGTRAGLSLVECELLTGRMHQIRVHLAAVGLPIVGDRVYGPKRLPPSVDSRLAKAAGELQRQALHAWRLHAPHPAGRATLDVCAPVPDDLRDLLAAAGIDADAALARRARG